MDTKLGILEEQFRILEQYPTTATRIFRKIISQSTDDNEFNVSVCVTDFKFQ